MKLILLTLVTLLVGFMLPSTINAADQNLQLSQSKTIYVKATAVGLDNGSSWENAYTSLQNALASANSGDEIWVAASTYEPTINTDRTITFRLKNEVAVYGGFAGTETSRAQRNWQVNASILSGDIGIENDPNDNSYHVVYLPDLADETTILDGFVITKGNANGAPPDNNGGGIYNTFGADWGFRGPTFVNLTITDNLASNDGGGMYNESSIPTLVNVHFTNNSAGHQGGGIANVAGGVNIVNGTFLNNHAQEGAGIAHIVSLSEIKNCTFVNNSASVQGGAIYHTDGSAQVVNSIFWGNTAPSNPAIRSGTSTVPVKYSLIQGGYSGTGNIDGDPQFINLAAGDLHLQSDSPAVNAGDNSSLPPDISDLDSDNDKNEAIPHDLDGSHRLVGSSVDMGAYEREIELGFRPESDVEKFARSGERVVTIEPPLTYGGATYQVHYFTTGEYAEDSTKFFFQATPDFFAQNNITGLLVTRGSEAVTDENIIRKILILYTAAHLLYEKPGADALGNVPQNFTKDLHEVTGNRLFQAFQVTSFFKSREQETEEALRGILTAQSEYASLKEFTDQVQLKAKQGNSLVTAVDLTLESVRFSNEKPIRELAAEILNVFQDWQPVTEQGTAFINIGNRRLEIANALDILSLGAQLIWLSQLQQERVGWLAIYQDAFAGGVGKLDNDQKVASVVVQAEAKQAWVQRAKIILDFAQEKTIDLGVKLGADVLADKWVKWSWQTFGKRTTGHLVAGAASAVLLGVEIGNLIYGLDDLYNNFKKAERADELRQVFWKGRLQVQQDAKNQDKSVYDGKLAERFRAAYMLEMLAAAQARRSYADGVAATYRLPNPVTWLHALLKKLGFPDVDWQIAVVGIYDQADATELAADTTLGHPSFLEAAVPLALARSSGFDPTTLPVENGGSFCGKAIFATEVGGSTMSPALERCDTGEVFYWSPLEFAGDVIYRLEGIEVQMFDKPRSLQGTQEVIGQIVSFENLTKLDSCTICASESPSPSPAAQLQEFTDLSANMPIDGPAMFNFRYSGTPSTFRVDVSTLSDMSWEVYLNFAAGAKSPLVESQPTKWDKYSCGRKLYWRVISDTGMQSSIQSTEVVCTAAQATAEQANLNAPFSNLSATVPIKGPAQFNFTFAGRSSDFRIDVSTVADMHIDVYLGFAVGTVSPLIETNPTKWDKVSCGRTLYWRVVSNRGAQSSIQSTEVVCTEVQTTVEQANLDAPHAIAFTSFEIDSGGIYLMNPDGSNSRKIASVQAVGPFGAFECPTWSPDGKEVAFYGITEHGEMGEIYIVRTDGSNLRSSTNNTGWYANPAWSPDGKLFAYNIATFPLHLVKVNSSDSWQIRDFGNDYNANDYNPDWSPDGQRLVFSSACYDPNCYDIYTINVDGTGLHQLTNNGWNESYPTWSPDGTLIAFSSDQNGNNEIYIMSTDGSNVRQLTNHPADDYDPTWSPDGKGIAFVSERDSNPEIYIMNADGSNVHNITNSPNQDLCPAWHHSPP